jgi:hypothetical protein
VLVVELSRPRLSAGGRRLSFRAVALRGNPGGLLREFRRRADRRVGSRFGRVSLFVDPGTQKVRLPAGLYQAKAPAPGKRAPLLGPAGVRSSNTSAPYVDCYPVQGFKSEANNRYVAAELGYGPFKYPRQNLYGMLRARATTVGAWEEHQFCIDKLTRCCWSIFTNANERWASTEIGYPGRDKDMLRARATSIGPWEQYRILCIKEEPGAFAIYSTASDRYVAAELGYKGDDYGMLRARSSTVGAWEKFFRFPGCPY